MSISEKIVRNSYCENGATEARQRSFDRDIRTEASRSCCAEPTVYFARAEANRTRTETCFTGTEVCRTHIRARVSGQGIATSSIRRQAKRFESETQASQIALPIETDASQVTPAVKAEIAPIT